MLEKHYMACPNCHARMKRTGQKEVESEYAGVKLYKRYYVCPRDHTWRYSESRNTFETIE